MFRNIKRIVLSLTLLLSFSSTVKAASLCSYEEQVNLGQKASNVQVSYEIKEKELKLPLINGTVKYIVINILNIDDDIYITLKNDYNSQTWTFDSSNTKDGMATIEWENVDQITNFTYEIHASARTKCPDDRYKTGYLTLPRYNDFADRTMCTYNPEFYMCQTFVTFKETDEKTFLSQLESYKNGLIGPTGEPIENPTLLDKILTFINNNKWYLVGGLVLIGGGLVVISIRNKKMRDLGL